MDFRRGGFLRTARCCSRSKCSPCAGNRRAARVMNQSRLVIVIPHCATSRATARWIECWHKVTMVAIDSRQQKGHRSRRHWYCQRYSSQMGASRLYVDSARFGLNPREILENPEIVLIFPSFFQVVQLQHLRTYPRRPCGSCWSGLLLRGPTFRLIFPIRFVKK